MLTNYFPILLFFVVAGGAAVGLIVAGYFLGSGKKTPDKLSPYECGFEAMEDGRMKFNIRFYLVGILFIVFDLEAAFMYPWAVLSKQLGGAGLLVMAPFFLALAAGLIYEWRKGALEWE